MGFGVTVSVIHASSPYFQENTMERFLEKEFEYYLKHQDELVQNY
jgi:hypothetical protein